MALCRNVSLLDNIEIQKKSYFLQMKFFLKILVYGKFGNISTFSKLKNPKLPGRIDTNVYGKLFVISFVISGHMWQGSKV